VFVKVVKGKSASAAPSKTTPGRANTSPWRAVSIVGGTYACKAARGVSHLRYLCGKAPSLPLASCDSRACNCRYEHHGDRRDDNRRNTAFRSTLETWRTEERRKTRGRRRDDRT
jgi:hypothetical protein